MASGSDLVPGTTAKKGELQELNMTGEVSDDIWKRSDLVLGDVLGQGSKAGSVHEGWWRIEDMKSQMVILRMVGEGDKAGDTTIQVSRSELLTSWSKRYIEEEVAYTTNDYHVPLITVGMAKRAVEGRRQRRARLLV